MIKCNAELTLLISYMHQCIYGERNLARVSILEAKIIKKNPQ